MSVFLIKKITI